MPILDAHSPSPAPSAPARPRRALCRPALLAATLGVLCVAALAVAAWRTSDTILHAGAPPTLHEQQVLAAGPGWVRLSRDAESLQPGTWALQWESGFGWAGRVVATNAAGVVREFHALSGQPPVGGWASLRGVARNADPRTLLGLAFTDVTFDSPLGRCPAWLVPGGDTTWVICVHGRGANRAEALRTVEALAPRGMPMLVVAYRGDAGAPRPPGGYSRLGEAEWTDLESAARFALANGARRLVLVGYSMGGQMVMQFLARSALVSRVAAVVLESPMLDWNAGLAYRARLLGVPAPLLWLGKQVAAARAGLDWGTLDRVARTGPFATPVLVLHARGDRYAPLSASEAFARRHPGNVRLVVLGAGNHVEAWNVGPERYRDLLENWLERAGVSPRAPRPPAG
jgi:uncharacterized protein